MAMPGDAPPPSSFVALDRALLERIVQQAADGILVADRYGRLMIVNEAAQRTAQRRVEQGTLDSMRLDWGAIYENGRPVARQDYALARALRGVPVKNREVQIVHDDGTSFDLSISAEPIRDSDGAIVAAVATFTDITARKRAEARLHESEARYRAVFEQAAVGIARVSTAGRFLEVNDRFCAITGHSRQALLAESFQQITHPDDLAANLAKIQAVLAGRIDTYTMEKRYVTKDGASVWVNLTVGPVRDEAGRPAYFVSVIEDIGARKEAEAAMRASEARYRTITDLSPDAVLVHVDERIVYANRAAAELLGAVAPDQIIGRSPLDFVASAYHGLVRERNARLLGEGGTNPLLEQVWRRLDGSPVDVEVMTGVITWQGRPAIQALARDVSERRRAANALRASEARYATLARLSPVGIFHTDAEGRCTYVNERWCEIAGCSAAEAMGEGWAALIHPEDRARILAEWNEAVARIRRFRTEYRYRRPDGSETWVLGQAAEEYDASGRLIGFVCTDTDITERKKTEEMNKLLMQELNHRVKNVIATVSSIARLTLRLDVDPKAALDAFQGRLRALANTHTLLSQGRWAGAPLAEVLRVELSPFGKSRYALEGPAVLLTPRAATTFSLVIHELATNAAKYGALSLPTGRVTVAWSTDARPKPKLRLMWQESGGPTVRPPARTGFGSMLITQSLEHEIGGVSTLAFGADGLTCTIEVPLAAAVVEPPRR
jgi:PAS domain S-box-containing protein